jgi:PadR family transcriptional regulator PadR
MAGRSNLASDQSATARVVAPPSWPRPGPRLPEARIKKSEAGVDRDLYSGLIRLHILHHADRQPIFGVAMIEELSRHGYHLSPGTVYPLLHGLEAKGYLKSVRQKNGSSIRRVYQATPAGRRALTAARAKVRELFGELFEDPE